MVKVCGPYNLWATESHQPITHSHTGEFLKFVQLVALSKMFEIWNPSKAT